MRGSCSFFFSLCVFFYHILLKSHVFIYEYECKSHLRKWGGGSFLIYHITNADIRIYIVCDEYVDFRIHKKILLYPVYMPFDLLAFKDLNYLTFQSFGYERYLMKVIPETRPAHHRNCKSQHIRMQHKLYVVKKTNTILQSTALNLR